MLHAGVSWGTLNSLIPKLLDLRIIIKVRKIGRATLYKINQENETAKQLIILYDKLMLKQLEEVKKKINMPAQ